MEELQLKMISDQMRHKHNEIKGKYIYFRASSQ